MFRIQLIFSIKFDAIISKMVNQRKDRGAFTGIMELYSFV